MPEDRPEDHAIDAAEYGRAMEIPAEMLEHPELVNAGRQMFAGLRELMNAPMPQTVYYTEPGDPNTWDTVLTAVPPGTPTTVPARNVEPTDPNAPVIYVDREFQPFRINMFAPPQSESAPTQSTIDPRITAEKLLMRVLPPELYVELNATGSFRFNPDRTEALPAKVWPQHSRQVLEPLGGYFCGPYPPFTYIFRREGKTEIETAVTSAEDIKRRFSACIAPSDPNCPDQDRIVAEFLLVKNREQDYLAEANLTDITPKPAPRPAPAPRPELRPLRDRVAIERRMDELTYDQAYQNVLRDMAGIRHTTAITISDTARECLRLLDLRMTELLPGWRTGLAVLQRANQNTVRATRPETIAVDFTMNADDMRLPIDTFSVRYLQPAMWSMARLIVERQYDILQFTTLPMPATTDNVMQMARIMDEAGISVRVSRQYDITTDRWFGRAELGLLLIDRAYEGIVR